MASSSSVFAKFAVLTALATFLASPANAQVISGSGVAKAASCNGGTAFFARTKGTAKNHDFGSTKLAATLVNAGNQTAGLQELFTYSQADASPFSAYSVDFMDDGVTRGLVNVHFCFRSSNGLVHGFDRTLNSSDFTISSYGDGWNAARINAAAFGFKQDNVRTLLKVTFDLSEQGNITLGSSAVAFGLNPAAPVSSVDLTPGDCSILDNCKNVNGK